MPSFTYLTRVTIISLIASSSALPAPYDAPFGGLSMLQGRSPQIVEPGTVTWASVTCDVNEIKDASFRADIRWKAADAEHAWSAVAHSWNHDAPDEGQELLPFPRKVSNFFSGPEGLNCEDISANTCNTGISCDTTSSPAGSMILNSFVAIHQSYHNRYTGLDQAMNQIQSSMGTFTDTFAPQLDDPNPAINDILGAFTFIVGIGSSFSWGSVAKLTGIFENENLREAAVEGLNGAIGLVVDVAKNHLPDQEDLQNGLTEAMGRLIGSWMEAEAEALRSLFSGAVGNLGKLHQLLHSGIQLGVPIGTDLATLKGEAQKIVYTRLIPAAWKVAPGTFSPFILAADSPCDDGNASSAQGDVQGHMDDATATQTRVCHDGKTFYVVTPEWTNNRGILGKWDLKQLPGGAKDTLDGTEWAGVTLDDLVVSAWDAYKLNGMENGYQLPENSQATDGNGGNGQLILGAGVRTPGFSTMSICDVNTLTSNLKNCNRNTAGFPCKKLKFANNCN